MITNPRSNMHKKYKKSNINKIVFKTGTNILNIFDN